MPARLLIAICLTVVISACATTPKDVAKQVSIARPPSGDTWLETTLAADTDTHPDNSGFTLIPSGRRAFTARVELADRAEKTLDLQYYIWDFDTTGLLLAERLLRAADRGVRIRLLLDDLNVDGQGELLAAMDAHPEVEIRLFNPFAHRDARLVDFVFDTGRVNHRMHNKIMVADNAVAIAGGRNIADIYFEVGTEANYRDLDLLAVGPVVQDVSHVFDYFWNSHWAVPIEAEIERDDTSSDLESVRSELRTLVAKADYPHPLKADELALEAAIPSIREGMVWAPGQVVWDDPAEFDGPVREGAIMRGLEAKLPMLERELLIESAYFVLPDPHVKEIAELVSRGVDVRILTNSLESNDVIAAHAGHAAHRTDLLRAGVELHEFKADAAAVEKRIFPMRSRAALHTKAFAFDREALFVGSFNLDPRSATLNTEIGLYVESPELASRLAAYMDEGVSLDSSYRVSLDESGELVWTTASERGLLSLTEEPGTSFGRRAVVALIQILPVEGQL